MLSVESLVLYYLVDPDFGNDNAANPSRTTPGEFAYRDGSPLVIQDEYSAKNT